MPRNGNARWTEQQYAEYLENVARRGKDTLQAVGEGRDQGLKKRYHRRMMGELKLINLQTDAKQESSPAATFQPDRMNKTERRYSLRLDAFRMGKEILWWAFESIKFRLADRTWYTPDFVIIRRDKSMEFHEVKGGFIYDDSKVKFKTCREIYSQLGTWRMMQWKGGEWREIL